ncbi:MAG: protein-methionine-sulfoxide reductase catalytic subunit MsrP [Rhodospirillaceae bacterium]|nr:protein-methionine-sulfoxide reductase catalytic subunit MsrP [Rhodospirillaceae bacterium]MCA8931721.1 protein-methionine-sulfoxide reductase catalytic subunit MsrP [Rhodospirillaceae bacterium]
MWIKRRKDWELPESAATPEHVYLNRRRFMQIAGGGAVIGAGALVLPRRMEAQTEAPADPTADLYPATANPSFADAGRALTDEEVATTYNNFYEFGSHKQIWRAAQALPTRPWTVTFDGMVEEERTVDIDTLIRAMPLEERVYRHRCVEAWAMTVPWSGFPMAALVDYARPLSSARYVRMQTFEDAEVAPGQEQFWYPWPYTEGLTIAEATNEVAFMVTGLYGRPVPRQNGAPLRLAVPWKYGFKSAKSIVRFTFTDQQPLSFWENLAGNEYGFWANVNPEVPHPRWSQATERLIGTNDEVPTQIFNGYGEQVAHLYPDLSDESYFH